MFESGSSCVVLVMAGLYVEAGVPSLAQVGDAAQRCARAALQARSTNSRGLARTGPVFVQMIFIGAMQKQVLEPLRRTWPKGGC